MNCNKCEAAIIWPKEYKPGNRPLNPDSTLHECMKTGPAQSKITETKPAKSPNTILAECIEFSETFKDITDARFDSLIRLYNTRVMQR